MRVNIHHFQGSNKPHKAAWLGTHSVVVCQTDGTILTSNDFRKGGWDVVGTSREIEFLTPLSSGRLLAIGGGSYHLISTNQQKVILTSQHLPTNLSAPRVCVAAQGGSCILVDQESNIWRLSEDGDIKLLGRIHLKNITAGRMVDGKTVIIGTAHGVLAVFDLDRVAATAEVIAHADSIQDIFLIGSSRFGTASRDRSLKIWDFVSGISPVHEIAGGFNHFINCATVRENTVWTGDSDGNVMVLSLEDYGLLHQDRLHKDAVRVLQSSPSKQYMLSLSDDGACKFVDTKRFETVGQYGHAIDYFYTGDFFVDSSETHVVLASASGGTVSGTLETSSVTEMLPTKTRVRSICHLSQNLVALAEDSGQITVYDKDRVKVLATHKTKKGLFTIRYSHSDQIILCGFRDGNVLLLVYPSPYGSKGAVEHAPKSRKRPHYLGSLVGAIFGRSNKDADLDAIVSMRIHNSIIGDIILYNQKQYMSCSDDQSIKVFSLPHLQVLKSFNYNFRAVNKLVEIGNEIAATTDEGTIILIRRDNFHSFRLYRGHSSPVRSIARVSDDLIVTGDKSGEIRLWKRDDLSTVFTTNLRDGKEIVKLGFDPFKRRILVASEATIASIDLAQTVSEDSLSQTESGNSLPQTVPDKSGDRAVKMFISYSHDDREYLQQIEKHLNPMKRDGLIETWYDESIRAGSDFGSDISDNLENADIILFLISPSFMASDYCYEIEMRRALERHDKQLATVIPVILRPTDWRLAPFAKLKALPRDGKPITLWSDRDEAYTEIAFELRKIVERYRVSPLA